MTHRWMWAIALTTLMTSCSSGTTATQQEVKETMATLEDTLWSLHTLNGREAGAGADGRRVDLMLESESGRAAGFSGCNRYTGGYTIEEGEDGTARLRFGPAAGTMMACPEGMELEREYLQTMGRVSGYRLRGEDLELLEGDTVVATFRRTF